MRFTVVFDVDEDLRDLFRELLEDEGMQNFSVIGVER